VIQGSLGLGGGLLAAIFASEALVRGGLMAVYATGVFIAIGLCARFFGGVKMWVYCLATLAMTALILSVGVPR
jgi:hypothetical protein